MAYANANGIYMNIRICTHDKRTQLYTPFNSGICVCVSVYVAAFAAI